VSSPLFVFRVAHTPGVSAVRPAGSAALAALWAAQALASRASFVSGGSSPGVNHLATAGENTWQLPRHAHLVVHEREDGGDGLLTIYACGAAQNPPTAQLVGTLGRVEADHHRRPQPTGYVLSLRESARLEQQPEHHWVIT